MKINVQNAMLSQSKDIHFARIVANQTNFTTMNENLHCDAKIIIVEKY